MNKLEELYEECGVYIDPHSTSATRKEIEFYAEQIVRECAEFARQHNLEAAERSYMIHDAIMKHFGVK